ncbi:hypothetical protein J1D01_15585 [Seonamhaeicola sp. NFXS20]|uniref:hypothetical protein n=1 Tax=unclassified Seonamhaeicola TaxID=2622645 RepID=UPI0035640295
MITKNILVLCGCAFIQFFSFNCFSQVDTLYFDIDDKEIDKVSFKDKLRSKFYGGVRYSTDTLVVQELIPNYVFGKLSPNLKSQLFKMLSSRNNIDTLKTLLIYYKDTLISRNEFPKRDYLIFRDSLGEVMGISKKTGWYFDVRPYKKAKYHEVKYSYKSFNKIMRFNFKKYKRFKQVEPVFFYGYNKGLDLNNLKVQWHKDYGHLIKKLFKYKNYWFRQLILKPNGEFFVSIGSQNIDNKELFNEKKWNAYRNTYFNKMKIN